MAALAPVVLGIAVLLGAWRGCHASEWAVPPGYGYRLDLRAVPAWRISAAAPRYETPRYAAPRYQAPVYRRAAPVSFAVPTSQPAELSEAALRVSQIAVHNGDRNFLMVDKARGKIMLFENGSPVLIRDALTGANPADQIPADAWSKPFWQQRGVRYKVTPAGRFTLTRDRDRVLGPLFDINELEGRDWTIAIHRVWLGNQAEHRDARLRSSFDGDKHITDGCVDVDPATIGQLLRILPGRGMPLYVLPMDESLIGRLFSPRGAPREVFPRPWRWPVWNASVMLSGYRP